MKNRIGMIVLILVCVVLSIGLIWSQKTATDQRQQTGSYSNKWVIVNQALDEQTRVNTELVNDRTTQKEALNSLSNNYVQVSANLGKTETALKATQLEVTNQLNKIADLESQNQILEQRAADLSLSITNLTAQIDDTRRKLAASQGDKEALTRELQRMVAEKADLERQFNDISTLKAQIAKIREETNISRRLAWQRKGLGADQKGAEVLMQRYPPVTNQPKQPQYDLNVEVTSEGGIRVIPPLTNSAAPPR